MFKNDGKSFYLENDNGEKIAKIEYTNVDISTISIDSTFVDPILKGQGIALKLVNAVVDLAISENKKIIPICSYAKKVFESNIEYQAVWKK